MMFRRYTAADAMLAKDVREIRTITRETTRRRKREKETESQK